MWNKRKQLAALTVVAGLLVLPTTNALAQSISPFGKGNPIESLSAQIDELRKSVNELKNPPIPTSLKGKYAGATISYCMIAYPEFSKHYPDGENWDGSWYSQNSTPYYQSGYQTLEYTDEKTDDADGKVFQTRSTITAGPIATDQVIGHLHRVYASNITGDKCPKKYKLKMAEGRIESFTQWIDWKQGGCQAGWGTREGHIEWQGHVLNGGKTIILTGTTVDVQKNIPPEVKRPYNLENEEICLSTSILSKVSD